MRMQCSTFLFGAMLSIVATGCSSGSNTGNGTDTGIGNGGTQGSGGATGSGGTTSTGGTSNKGGTTGSGGVGGSTGATGGAVTMGGQAILGGSTLVGGITGNGGTTGGAGGGGGVGGAVIKGDVERWGVFELSLTGPSSGNPYVDVQWSATFTQGDKSIKVPGFWDGGSTYKLRFSPPTTGDWSYLTTSAATELNGKTGSLKVGDATGDNHGPVEIFDTYYLRYADGSRYHQFGTTAYAWIHQSDEVQKQTLETLSTSAFNKMRMCIFPKDYVYNHNEPQLFAFQKTGGKFDFTKPDPAFWKHLEGRILDLQKLGIQADLILWHNYDRWGFSNMGDVNDDRYLRYCIARLSAFRNVWWSMANEFDFLKRPMETWDRYFSILQKEDPHQRFRGIHNGFVTYDHTKAWVTHASLQEYKTYNGILFRDKYKKPILFDESRYEGNIKEGFGNISGNLMAQIFWDATFSGAYQGHGECILGPNEVIWWAKGGVFRGTSPPRIKWFKEMIEKAPPFNELKPNNMMLVKDGEYYLVYCQDTKAKTVELKGTRSYTVESLDLWEMKVTAVGTAPPGPYTFTPPKAYVAYRFTPVP